MEENIENMVEKMSSSYQKYEQRLQEAIHALNDRERSLDVRERDLNDWNKRLDNQAEAQEIRRKELDEEKRVLEGIGERIREVSASLDQTESDIHKRRDTLFEQERSILSREQELGEKEEELARSIKEVAHERNILLEKKKKTMDQENTVIKDLLETIPTFLESFSVNDLETAKKSLADLAGGKWEPSIAPPDDSSKTPALSDVQERVGPPDPAEVRPPEPSKPPSEKPPEPGSPSAPADDELKEKAVLGLKKTRERIITAREKGVDISEIEAQYKGAEPAFNQGRFGAVLEILETTQEKLETALKVAGPTPTPHPPPPTPPSEAAPSNRTLDEGDLDDLEKDMDW